MRTVTMEDGTHFAPMPGDINDTVTSEPASTPSPRISIVGTGPAGLYAAQTLLRALPDAEITLWDRSPMPFGLIRAGVAADHPHTKRIARQFDRLWQSPQVRFAGGVTVIDAPVARPHISNPNEPADPVVSLQTLRRCYDAVVLATGRSADRILPIPGAQDPIVYGAGSITRRLNAAPGADRSLSALGTDVVLIGAGNVALDILRFLVKTEDDYEGSDVDATALAEYRGCPAQRITVLARSSMAAGTGDPQMWRELASLRRGTYRVHEAGYSPSSTHSGTDTRTAAARRDAIASLTDPARTSTFSDVAAEPQIDIYFGARPLRIDGTGPKHVGTSSIEFDWEPGTKTVTATSVITAIGFDVADDDPLAFAAADPTGPTGSGKLAPDLYRTGWLKRGPVGAIPENRSCAKAVIKELLNSLESGELKIDPAKPGFEGMDRNVRNHHVTTAQWQRFNTAEITAAAPGRTRTKYLSRNQLVAAAASIIETNRRDPE